MITCPKCGSKNDETKLRCQHCDEWFIRYEFKNLKKPRKPTKGTKAEKAPPSSEKKEPSGLFAEQSTNNDEVQPESIFSPLEIQEIKDDASLQAAFSPECPNCGGEIKSYEVRCRHCGVLLRDKMQQSKKLKPYWEQMFKSRVLSAGNYEDVTNGDDTPTIFKKSITRGNKLFLHIAYLMLFLLVVGSMLGFCVSSVFSRL